MSTTTYDQLPWQDRFNQPSIALLRKHLGGEATRLFDRARRRLLEMDGLEERFTWRGDCWRWTIEYAAKRADEPLALIIPSPADLQMAIPLDREFVRSLSVQRMKRTIRDGLELAQDPFDTRWGVWSIQSSGLLDDLQELIELKVKHQQRLAG